MSAYTSRVCFALSFLVVFSSVGSAFDGADAGVVAVDVAVAVAGAAAWSAARAAPEIKSSTDVANGVVPSPLGPPCPCPMCICCIWNALTGGAPITGRWGSVDALGRLGGRCGRPVAVCGGVLVCDGGCDGYPMG